jgi:hypothetical protein
VIDTRTAREGKKSLAIDIPQDLFNELVIIGGPLRPHGYYTHAIIEALEQYIANIKGARESIKAGGGDTTTWLDNLVDLTTKKKGRVRV